MRPKIHCVIPHVSPASANRARLTPYNRLILTQPRQSSTHLLHPPASTANPKSHTTKYSLPSQSPTRYFLPTRPFSTSIIMASDDAYMSFLDKANQDVSGDQTQKGATVKTETVHSSLSVPKALQSVDAYYVSETDEPFEPVALKWDGAAKGSWPSAGMSCPA